MKKGMICRLIALTLILGFAFTNIQAQSSSGTGATVGQRYLVTPNPSGNFAMVISLGDGVNIAKIAINNNLGQLVSSNNYGDNTRVAMLDVSSLSAGVYTISISSSVSTETQILGVNFPICPPYCP
jgi:hypothetical protein